MRFNDDWTKPLISVECKFMLKLNRAQRYLRNIEQLLLFSLILCSKSTGAIFAVHDQTFNFEFNRSHNRALNFEFNRSFNSHQTI